ncbi:ABC transporter permease, partial [Pseudomonas syringae pv. maculicola]
MLLLFGLKHGVVGQLQAELLRDPRNLEIKLLSSGNYDEQWLNRLQQRPETGFALGMTRSLNTQADLIDLVWQRAQFENAIAVLMGVAP